MEKTKYTEEEIKSLIARFEAQKLPKAEWTHPAHLLVAIWYKLNYKNDEAMSLTRNLITRHNESVGTENSDDEGYHETITRFWLWVASQFIAQNKYLTLEALSNTFIASGFGKSAYPLNYYSKDLLFSVEARHNWMEPDLENLNELLEC